MPGWGKQGARFKSAQAQKDMTDYDEVQKVEPLKCPQCGSTHVKAGFTKRVNRAFMPDGKIWCYACKKVTDKNGKFKAHNYSMNIMGEENNE